MRKKDFYYNNKPGNCGKHATFLLLIIFCLSVATFALLELHNIYTDQPTLLLMLRNNFKDPVLEESSANKFVLKNLEQQQEQVNHIATDIDLNSERQARAAGENKTNSEEKSNSYYEEQTPVVVYSRTDIDSPIVQRQMADIPPRQDTDEDDPYSKILDENYESSDDNDYFGQPEQRQPQTHRYYTQQPEEPPRPNYRAQPSQTYYKQPASYYPKHQSSPEYYDNSDKPQQNSEAARATQYNEYGNYYTQYPYATPPPMLAARSGSNSGLIQNGNLQLASKTKVQQQTRDPYSSYKDDYDYWSAHPQSVPAVPFQPSYYENRKPLQQQYQPQYQQTSSTFPLEEKQEAGPQMDLLTMFKSIKTMWDLYQSFTSSWNTIAEKHNREEEIAKQKYKQTHQTRINSKKPPKFNSRRNSTSTTKHPRKQATATKTTVMPTTNLQRLHKSNEAENKSSVENQEPVEKVEPRRSVKEDIKGKAKAADMPRDKRQTDKDGMSGTTNVGEARYIKGDPLKGYYDFVITEGSYKFWAVFQVGTAILIIYSTFAAIYYSKVNPLVSDYDYTDYLGGARSLGGNDLDFVDDSEGNGVQQQKSWLSEWLPRTGHSLKFILDAIDKLPTDHKPEDGATSGSHEANDEESEYADESAATTETSSETGIHNSNDYENFEDNNYDNEAM